MPFSKKELEKLRSELPRKAAAALAGELGLEIGSVRNILSGRSNNEEVILRAFEIANEYQEKMNAVKSALAV